MATPMNDRITRRFMVVLRSEWLRELACEQVITNKKRVNAKELTAYQAVSKPAT
jgi:hypothetical protein